MESSGLKLGPGWGSARLSWDREPRLGETNPTWPGETSHHCQSTRAEHGHPGRDYSSTILHSAKAFTRRADRQYCFACLACVVSLGLCGETKEARQKTHVVLAFTRPLNFDRGLGPGLVWLISGRPGQPVDRSSSHLASLSCR